MSMIGWTETLSKLIENRVQGFLQVTPSLYNYFEANGMIRNYGDGVDKVQYFKKEKPDGAHMASTIHNANIVSPLWTEKTVGFLYLAARLAISKMDYDKYARGQWISGDLVQDTISDMVPLMLNQVDQFLAWGDYMKSYVDALDKYAGTGTFTGIFNSGTTLAAGIGLDNDVTDKGDYTNTTGRYKKALKAAAHEQPEYLLLSDMDTELQADIATNHIYETTGQSEYDRVMDKKYVQDWMSSANFNSRTSTQYRIAMIAPKTNPKTVIGQKGIVNNFELYQGYKFNVTPFGNGGLSTQGFYEWLVEWNGRLVVHEDTSVQHSGDLIIAD